MGHTACTEPQYLYSRAIPLVPLWAVRPVQSLSTCTVQLYLYSPLGRTACTEPQYLYSTATPLLPSVPVQYSYTSTPLSACTIQLYHYSPYGPYGLYRASVPVQYSYTSTPLWAVRPVQSLSACTMMYFTYLLTPWCRVLLEKLRGFQLVKKFPEFY